MITIKPEEYKEWMRENYPADYRRMKKEGTLDDYVKERIEMAEEYWWETRKEQIARIGGADDYWENYALQMQAESIATELTFQMLYGYGGD